MEINYDEVTIQDCLSMFYLKHKTTIINDTKVLGFEDADYGNEESTDSRQTKLGA